jgi:hypothetical protein
MSAARALLERSVDDLLERPVETLPNLEGLVVGLRGKKSAHWIPGDAFDEARMSVYSLDYFGKFESIPNYDCIVNAATS